MFLGKREVDELTCPPGRRDVLVFDDRIKGFCVRVTSDGAKVYLLQYRRGSAVRRLRLGRHGEITNAQARRLAEVARGEVSSGGDPVGRRRAELASEMHEQQEKRQRKNADALTLEKLIAEWQAKQLAIRSESYRREATRALRAGLSKLLDRPAEKITAEQIRPLLQGNPPSGSGGNAAPRGLLMAKRTRMYGHALYAWAIGAGLVVANPFAAVTVAAREVKRERWLSGSEVGEVWHAAGALGWPWTHYFRMLLLTLQREGEVAGMRWSEISPDLSTWTLPGARTKNGRQHIVHLAEPARAILREVPRMQVEGGRGRPGATPGTTLSDLVFTTTGTTAISGFSHAKLRLDKAIAMARTKREVEGDADHRPFEPWRLHDFRRTGATTLAQLGISWEVADKVLNHVQGAITGVAAVYQRHEYLAERLAALDAWAAHVVAVASEHAAAG